MITFAEARAVVEKQYDMPTTEYGWENDTEYLVPLDFRGDIPFDGPDRMVDKETGKLREVYGSLGGDPVPGLRPIGNVPG